MRHYLYVAALLLLFTTSTQVNAQPTGTSQSTTVQSAIPKVEDSVKQSLALGNYQEVLVEFDDTAIQTSAANIRKLAKVEHDNTETLNFKASEYVKLKDSVMSGVTTSEHEKLTEYSHLPLTLLRLKSTAALDTLLADPRVKRIHKNGTIYPMLDSVSAGYVNQPAVNARGFTGAGASVAVIDSGVNYTQADFGCTAPGVPVGCRVAYYANLADTSTALDTLGHGTNVAGIVHGVAPGANIIALNVFGASATTTDAVIIAGINWAIANQTAYNIVSINLSLGNNYLYDSAALCAGSAYDPVTYSAHMAGIQIFAASGNNASSVGITSPACVGYVQPVGAVYDASIGAMGYGICTDASSAPGQIACFTNLPSAGNPEIWGMRFPRKIVFQE